MQEIADQLAAARIDAFARVFDVVLFTHRALVGLAQLGADVDLGNAGLDAAGDVILYDAAAAMQHQRDIQGAAQLGDAFDIQLGGGLFLIQQIIGNRAVYAADRHSHSDS